MGSLFAVVVCSHIAEDHCFGHGVAIRGPRDAEVFYRCERNVEHHLGVTDEDEVHFAVGRFKGGKVSIFVPKHLHIGGERHISSSIKTMMIMLMLPTSPFVCSDLSQNGYCNSAIPIRLTGARSA